MVLTERVREPPSSAYTAIGTMQVYSPTSAGRPATVAYAIAWGMTTAPAASPPTTPPASQARSDPRSHGAIGSARPAVAFTPGSP